MVKYLFWVLKLLHGGGRHIDFRQMSLRGRLRLSAYVLSRALAMTTTSSFTL